MTVLATGIIYPIVGHWAWSSSKYDTVSQLLSTGWDLGFIDFAGSTIVHSVGGWIALDIELVNIQRQIKENLLDLVSL